MVLFLFVSQLNAQIERDKALHFLGGGLFGLAGAGIAKHASDGNRVWTFVGAVAGSALVGVAKEAIDAGQEGNQWDNEDLAATILGGVTVGVTIEIFSKKRNKRRPMGSLTTQRLDWNQIQVDSGISKVMVPEHQLPSWTTLTLSTKSLKGLE